MGMSLSYPRVKEPESYVDPDFDEDSEDMNFAKEMHDINLRYTYAIIQQRVRSLEETSKFEKYSYDWDASVSVLQVKHPDWTAEDLLNLKRQFELFDVNGDRLLDFNEFDMLLDLMNDDSDAERRRELFQTADREHYDSISFEDYLQFMYDIRQGTPPPQHPGSEDEDTAAICEVARMDTFQQMCYGVF